MIKVIIADDIQILRQGLEAILVRDPEIQVAGLAANGKEALALCSQHHPDVVLMDMRMPGYDGSWGICRIKQQFPDIRVLVLTTFDDDETVEAALSSGEDALRALHHHRECTADAAAVFLVCALYAA